MNNATFIGIDLAWRSERNPTGAVVLKGDRSGAQLEVVATLCSVNAVLAFIRASSTPETVLAIDAPLIIVNETGQRGCETLVGKHYGKRDASCHTSNLKLYKAAPSVSLAQSCLSDGFVHAEEPNLPRGRVLAEVYPHAAMVALFDLPKIIKYKKGSVIQKRAGLTLLQTHLERLSVVEPVLLQSDSLATLLHTDLHQLAGRALKNYEDILDALFCAYLAFYFWYWGWKRNHVFGDIRSGYILNPSRPHANPDDIA